MQTCRGASRRACCVRGRLARGNVSSEHCCLGGDAARAPVHREYESQTAKNGCAALDRTCRGVGDSGVCQNRDRRRDRVRHAVSCSTLPAMSVVSSRWQKSPGDGGNVYWRRSDCRRATHGRSAIVVEATAVPPSAQTKVRGRHVSREKDTKYKYDAPRRVDARQIMTKAKKSKTTSKTPAAKTAGASSGSKKDPRLQRAGVSGYNKPKRTPSHPKKYGIVVAKEGSQVKTIRFGQQGAETNKSAAQRSAFVDRHRKNIARGKMSAAYWANKVRWDPKKTPKKPSAKTQKKK